MLIGLPRSSCGRKSLMIFHASAVSLNLWIVELAETVFQ
jgi:hypothetical protein